MGSAVFSSPSAHDVREIRARFVGVLNHASGPFTGISLTLQTGSADAEISIYGPAAAADKFEFLAQAINHIFGPPS